MPKFRIEIYETHISTVIVDGDNRADAICKYFEGSGSHEEKPTKYVQVDEDKYQPLTISTKDYNSLPDEYKADDKCVYGIRSIKRIREGK